MAEEMKSHDDQVVDKQDRGLFDFMKKDKNSSKPHDQEAAAVSESADHFKEKVKIEDEKEKAHEKQEEEEEEEGEKKPSLLEKLHRSNSSSSSSSSDEEGEGEEKKKKKKKEKKKVVVEDTTVPVEKVEEHPEELGKKGFLEKIKHKLPVGANKTQDQNPAAAVAAEQHPHETSPTAGSDKEKKGFLDKIKEKLPGYHPSNTQDQTAGPQDHHSN